jgi:hypothetical protein
VEDWEKPDWELIAFFDSERYLGKRRNAEINKMVQLVEEERKATGFPLLTKPDRSSRR